LPGRLISTGPVTFYTGGMVANTGLSLHRLGIPIFELESLGSLTQLEPGAETHHRETWEAFEGLTSLSGEIQNVISSSL
jgi:hypothetical protein